MEAITKITVTEDVALITLQNSPSQMAFITRVFREIAGKGINVDMISQTAPLGGKISLSFTVPGSALGDVFDIFKMLRVETPELKPVISGGNYKISLSGEIMRSLPGVAAHVFDVISGLNIDIRIITTSEVDISLLVTQADYHLVADVLENKFHVKPEIQ